MTDTMTDPFASTTDDPFATPSTEFVTIDDVDGRLIVAIPLRMEQKAGKSDGKPYDVIVADVIVVDGPTTDKIPAVPFTIPEMHLSAGMVVGQLRQYVGKGRPVLGRVNSKPSRINKALKAYALSDPDQADKGKALPVYRAYQSEQANSTFGG